MAFQYKSCQVLSSNLVQEGLSTISSAGMKKTIHHHTGEVFSIEVVKNYRSLGVYLTSKLNWADHVDT